MPRIVASEIAACLVAIANCRKAGNLEWLERHTRVLQNIAREYLPHGAGFDEGTRIDQAGSDGKVLRFETSFHHMNETGYIGWTHHRVTVISTFNGPEIRVSGRDLNDIKDYIADVFRETMAAPVTDEFIVRAYEEVE